MKVRFICRINIVLIKSIQLYLPYKLKTYTMKKVLLTVAVVALFASCKKDYTCTCTYIDFDLNGNSSTETYVETYSSVTGANANLLQATCEATTTNTNGSSNSTPCVWDKK